MNDVGFAQSVSVPDIATGGKAALFPLPSSMGADLETSNNVLKVTVKAIQAEPAERLMLQVKLANTASDNPELTPSSVQPDALNSVIYSPLKVGETRDLYFVLPPGKITPAGVPLTAVISLTRTDGSGDPVKSSFEVLSVSAPKL